MFSFLEKRRDSAVSADKKDKCLAILIPREELPALRELFPNASSDADMLREAMREAIERRVK